MTSVLFYDNLEPSPADDDPSMVEVERIYCLDFDRFSDGDWARLDATYRTLPGDYRECQTPMWFGSRDDEPPFLWASVEPPGLQVYGVLPIEHWQSWDASFLAALKAGGFPFRELTLERRRPSSIASGR